METIKTPIKIPNEFKELFNPEWRNIVFYGGRASGKSENVARALLLRGRQEKLRILCTREIQNTIKDSVHRLLTDLIEKYKLDDFSVYNDTIVNDRTGSEFIFKGLRLNINEIKSTQGIDLCWVEEAQSVSEKSLDILTPTVRKKGSQLIFTFNRYDELDPVYVKFVQNKPDATYVAQVNFDVLERNNMLPDVIKLEIEADKDNPALYQHKWLGEPVSQSDFSILPRDKILDAMQRTVNDDGETVVGVDVARMGNDRTVFWKRKGLMSVDSAIYNHKRTTEVCDLLERFIDYSKKILIKVDDTGVGGGVTDEMLRRGYNVEGVNFGGQANDKDKYPNWISEAWFTLAEKLPELGLIHNPDLLMELSTRQWKQDIRGRRQVESKGEYKKRGYRSPDIADAVVIAYSDSNQLSGSDFNL